MDTDWNAWGALPGVMGPQAGRGGMPYCGAPGADQIKDETCAQSRKRAENTVLRKERRDERLRK